MATWLFFRALYAYSHTPELVWLPELGMTHKHIASTAVTGRTEKWARAGTRCWRIWFTASGECDSTAASSELAAASAARSGCAGGIEAVQQPEGSEEAQWWASVPFPANVCAQEHLP